jgi:hypothetical protein
MTTLQHKTADRNANQGKRDGIVDFGPRQQEEHDQIRKISSVLPAAIIFKACVAKIFPGLFKEHAEIRLDLLKDALKSK